MKKLLLLICTICCLAFSSCGFLAHNTTNANLNNTTVVLDKKNYHIVKTVQGESSQLYVLGIGGLSGKSLGTDAVRQMYQNANLKGSQAIINASIVYQDQFYFIAWKTKARATGYVIEFDE